MKITRDKVVGCFLGVAVGDALGAPFECMTREKIAKYGRVTDYIDKRYGKGETTDDWQLTAAVAEAMIEAKDFDLSSIAAQHVKAAGDTVAGWGSTTRAAVKEIAEGTPWRNSGQVVLPMKPTHGVGNGVCMKVSPVAAFMATTMPGEQDVTECQKLADFGGMTHYTRLGIASGFAHCFGLVKCFTSDPAKFKPTSYVSSVVAGALCGNQYLDPRPDEPDLFEELQKLFKHAEYDLDKMVADFGGGSPYVFHSLPFSLMFFVKDQTINALFEVVNAGGDVDSNASMVASCLGALHGQTIFPDHLVDGLKVKEQVLDVANRFCDTFSIV